MKLRLIDKVSNGINITSFFFKPDEPLEFKPGQFLRYHITNPSPDERGENRFFSISSSPFENVIRLTTKFSPDGGSSFKKDLENLQVGGFIEASIPKGSFSLDDKKEEYVFIAGGIGITPFRSILLDLDHRGKHLNVSLLYANKIKDALFRNELEELAQKHPEFKIFYIISDESVVEQKLPDNISTIHGKIDEALIRKLVPNIHKPMYYISGPELMVETFEEIIWSMGVAKELTKRDYFPGYDEY